MSTLEKRISAALASDTITASDLAALVAETDKAIATADEVAEVEREKALDLSRSPDPVKARQAMEDAQFTGARLRTVRPRLQQRHDKVERVERKARWIEQYDEIRPRLDALASELTDLYTTLVPKLVDLLTRARALNVELENVRSAKPYPESGEPLDGRDLLDVELHARGVTALPPGTSLDRDLVLPGFTDPKTKLWPPPTVSLATEYARRMMAPSHVGSDWWKKDPAAIAQENARHDASIAQAKARAREREERENAEADRRAREAAEKVRRAAGWPR